MIRGLRGDDALAALLSALESAGYGCTIIVDRGDRLERVYANAAIARIFGLDVDGVMKLPVMDVLTATERERLAQLRRSLGDEPAGPPTMETKIQRADGTLVPVELGLAYAQLEGARATFVFMRDATSKAAMEAALRDSEERFRRLAEASPDSITVYSIATNRYLYANPIAMRHLGISGTGELANVDPHTVLSAERNTELRETFERVMRGEAIPPITNRLRKPDGGEVVLESSLSLATLGGAPAIISCTRDITERVRLQAELMKQDRLASVGILAAGVAHELNNPLTSLGIQVRKLRESADARGLPADVKQSLDQIDDAASRMNGIITDLLFMARPVEKPQAHVDVGQILRSTVALFSAGIVSCPPIAVEIEDLPPIAGYASKLGQVFLNLLRNAVQALDGRTDGEIRVRARHVAETVEIVVEDNGAGIPAEVLTKVTQPFFTTKQDGTGLGLWISQTLVAHHRGSLEVGNREGPKGGAAITVRLPTGPRERV